jgi:hypothetical protein
MASLAVQTEHSSSNRAQERENPAREIFDALAKPLLSHTLFANVAFPTICSAIARVHKKDPIESRSFAESVERHQSSLTLTSEFPQALPSPATLLKEVVFAEKVADELKAMAEPASRPVFERETPAPRGRIISAPQLAA